MWATDRQRVEVMLPAQMMLVTVLEGAKDRDEEFERCKAHLMEACAEPLRDITDRHRRKLLNRVTRVQKAISKDHMDDGKSTAKFGLILYYLLRAVTECGYLVFAEGTAIDKALEIFLPALQPAADKLDVDKSAQKQARRMLSDLHLLGYFREVAIPEN